MTTTLVLTSAPNAYDYGYVVEHATGLTVEQYDGQRNPPTNVRLVTMPSESVAYQTARYQSGMYMTKTFAVVNDDEVEGSVKVLISSIKEQS